jgi:hypothetical protein
MQITVTIPDEIAAEIQGKLAAEAQRRGLALDRYLTEKLVGSLATDEPQSKSASEAVDRIRELRKGNLLAGLSIKEMIEGGRRY